MPLKKITATFTRPSDTTAYTIADLVANSVTAGSVVPMTINIGGSGGRLHYAKLKKSGTTITNATFNMHLFGSSPTFVNGDNGALSYTATDYLGKLPFTIMVAGTDVGNTQIRAGETNFIYPWTLPFAQVFAVLEAAAAYTPASAEVFTLLLGIEK